MKKLLLSISFSLFALILMQSCQKETNSLARAKQITIDTTIAAGSDYLLSLAPYGYDDDIATILQQGNNYEESTLEDESDLFTTVYHYTSSDTAKGTNQVIISIKANPLGGQVYSNDSTLVYINLTLK